jgi:hypothetical protein
MAYAMRRHLIQGFASVVVVLYMAVCVASHNRNVPLGKWVYKQLRPMHTTLCLWQNWAMFAPAPTTSSWVHFTGITSDGTEVELEPLYSRLEEGFWRWRYDRKNKLVMSGFGKKRKVLRRALGKYYCRLAAEDGLALAEVRIDRERQWPQSLKRARNDLPPHKKPTTTELGTFKCQ